MSVIKFKKRKAEVAKMRAGSLALYCKKCRRVRFTYLGKCLTCGTKMPAVPPPAA